MKVCVAGLWHLGSVTAACLAAAGHDVVGLDADRKTVARLNEGKPLVLRNVMSRASVPPANAAPGER